MKKFLLFAIICSSNLTLAMEKSILVTIDVDKTIGQHFPISSAPSFPCKIFDADNIIELPGSLSGNFYFYQGAKDFLHRLHNLQENGSIQLAFYTASFDINKEKRNSALLTLLKEEWGLDYQLYDAKYLTFYKFDLLDAQKSQIPIKQWQMWFNGLLTAYSINDLYSIDEDDIFHSYFIKDHDTLVQLAGLQSTIKISIHIDDQPHFLPPDFTHRENFFFINFSREDPEHSKKFEIIAQGIEKIIRDLGFILLNSNNK